MATTTTRKDIARELDRAAGSIQAAQQVINGMHVAIDAMPELLHNQYWTDAYRAAVALREEMEDDQQYWMGVAVEAGFTPEDFGA